MQKFSFFIQWVINKLFFRSIGLRKNEDILFDTSIQRRLLKDYDFAEKFLKRVTLKIEDAGIILNTTAALEIIGFPFKLIPADYILSNAQRTILLKILTPERDSVVRDAQKVVIEVFDYYREEVLKIKNQDGEFIFSQEFIHKKNQDQRGYIDARNLDWWDEAVKSRLSATSLQSVAELVAFDRLVESSFSMDEKLAVQFVIYAWKLKHVEFFSEVVSYRLAQNYVKNVFLKYRSMDEFSSTSDLKSMATKIILSMDQVSLRGLEDYLDSESISFLLEGYNGNPVYYFTLESVESIAGRLNVAKYASNQMKSMGFKVKEFIFGRVGFVEKKDGRLRISKVVEVAKMLDI